MQSLKWWGRLLICQFRKDGGLSLIASLLALPWGLVMHDLISSYPILLGSSESFVRQALFYINIITAMVILLWSILKWVYHKYQKRGKLLRLRQGNIFYLNAISNSGLATRSMFLSEAIQTQYANYYNLIPWGDEELPNQPIWPVSYRRVITMPVLIPRFHAESSLGGYHKQGTFELVSDQILLRAYRRLNGYEKYLLHETLRQTLYWYNSPKLAPYRSRNMSHLYKTRIVEGQEEIIEGIFTLPDYLSLFKTPEEAYASFYFALYINWFYLGYKLGAKTRSVLFLRNLIG